MSTTVMVVALAEPSPALVGLGIGIALAGAPGPVQAVLIAEAIRGGVPRGLRAVAGASLTFGTLLAAIAFGLTLATPGDEILHGLTIAGGVLLVWLAVDALRSPEAPEQAPAARGLPPVVRGSMAILLNPGAWLFLAAVASPLIAEATAQGGGGAMLMTCVALLIGAACGDVGIVLIGGLGARRMSSDGRLRIHRLLAGGLGLLGIGLLTSGTLGLSAGLSR